MGDPPAVGRASHERLVDVIGREVAGDAGEQVDVALAHGLGEPNPIADREAKLSHGNLPGHMDSAPTGDREGLATQLMLDFGRGAILD